jgi:DNA-binding transcriptional ArsR family regulator
MVLLKRSHLVELIIDGKKIKTEANDLLLKIDNLSVYQFPNIKTNSSKIQTISLKFLLRSANAAFGHDERFEIVRSLAEFPKTFSEIKEIFDMPSPTLNFHLKKMTKSWVVYKNRDGKYAMTLLGELLLNYFSKFLEEAAKLQESMGE